MWVDDAPPRFLGRLVAAVLGHPDRRPGERNKKALKKRKTCRTAFPVGDAVGRIADPVVSESGLRTRLDIRIDREENDRKKQDVLVLLHFSLNHRSRVVRIPTRRRYNIDRIVIVPLACTAHSSPRSVGWIKNKIRIKRIKSKECAHEPGLIVSRTKKDKQGQGKDPVHETEGTRGIDMPIHSSLSPSFELVNEVPICRGMTSWKKKNKEAEQDVSVLGNEGDFRIQS